MKLILITLISLFSSCSHLFYFPDRVYWFDPAKLKIEKEEIYFESTDKTKLYAWHLKRHKKFQKSKGLIIQFHGNAQNLTSHWPTLGWLTKEGYDVFVFDYRGYGISEGQANQQGLYKDALAALDFAYALKEKLKAEKFIVYAQSLGGNVCARAIVDFKLKQNVDLLVLESTFDSYQGIAAHKLLQSKIFAIFWPLTPFVVSNEYASIYHLHKIKMPTLVIHGKKDNVVPHFYGKKIYDQIGSQKKWFWDIDEAAHLNLYYIEKNKYRDKFLSLIANI